MEASFARSCARSAKADAVKLETESDIGETLSQKEKWAKNVSGHCKQTERHTG
jgi:hypothetical protein